MGYAGLILTDDMEMGAIAQLGSLEDAVVEACRAGADVILVCHTAEKALAAHEALMKAAEQGRVSAQRLRESAQRIARFHTEWTAHKTT
jgi:beta-N-acetylhexosaminidase